MDNSYRPICDCNVVGFISLLSPCDSPSKETIHSLLFENYGIKGDIHIFQHFIYSNPDECDSSQWFCTVDMNEHDFNEINNNTLIKIDLNNDKQLKELYDSKDVLFDEESFTLLFSKTLFSL